MSLELSTVGKIIGKQKNNENANTSTCGRRREAEEKEVRRDDRRRNGEDIILSFSFLVPGSCPLFASRVTSFLTAISRSESGPPTLSRSSTYVCFVRRSFAIVVFAHSPYHSPDHNHSNL